MEGWRLALGELRPLARLLEARLAALLLARIAREVAAALELDAQAGLCLHERTGDPVTERAGLCGDAATLNARLDVHARQVAGGLEGLTRLYLEALAREVHLERLAI